jgi:hypothetical protein
MRCQPVGGACAMACGARSQACVSAVRCPLSGVCARVSCMVGAREQVLGVLLIFIYIASLSWSHGWSSTCEHL